MPNFTTEIMETLLTKGDLDELFRRHLESAINLLLQAELTTFLDYEKYDRTGFNSGNSRNGNYSRSFKTEYGELNLVIPRDLNGEFSQHTLPAYKRTNDTLYGDSDDKSASKSTPKVEVNVIDQVISSPMSGKIVELADVSDKVFSSGSMGQGVAINPSVGEVVAPSNGTVQLLFPTKHAIGFLTEDGAELLIHIGMDTVELEGKYFEAFVKQGDRVTAGQKLVGFNIDAIQKAGYSMITPIIVTNTPSFTKIDVIENNEINVLDPLLDVKK